MSDVKIGELRTVVETVRQIVMDWDGFVGSVEGLVRDLEESRHRLERQAQELAVLQAANVELRRAQADVERVRQDAAHQLVDLQARHDSLLATQATAERDRREAEWQLGELRDRHEHLRRQHLDAVRELEELRERHQAMLDEQRRASDELELVLRRLRVTA